MGSEILKLIQKAKDISNKHNIEFVNKRILEIRELMQSEDFWNDQEAAKKLSKELSILKNKLRIVDILTELESLLELSKLASSEEDSTFESELKENISIISAEIEKIEINTYFSSKYDQNDAIFSIFAGQGGTEANDWAQMIERMYLKFFEKMNWKYELIDRINGTETGINSAVYEVYGDYAYGYLKTEMGTHRLVRVSPFNAQGLRQTSFAGVEVGPLIDDEAEIEIKDSDIQFSAVRSGGAGGQNVNKVSTNVSILHIPTQIKVNCSTGRSQLANKKSALALLRSKLFILEQKKRDSELAGIKGEHKMASWGNQIRNYVLNPYKLVKDIRSRYETTDVIGVLDGNLLEFILSNIKK